MAELAWEAQYYAKISLQLGERFATVVERALAIATEFPDMGSLYKYGTRRVFPKRFPFSVVYLHRSDEILVLAIAPDDRKPGYWRSRMIKGNMSMDSDSQQPEAALPRVVVRGSSSR